MTEQDTIKAGVQQMDFKMVDHDGLELPTSTPATYGFVEPATYNPERFDDELDKYEFGLVGVNTKEKDDGSFYYYADVVTDHYKKIHVKIWNEKANLYPKEELVDTYEVSRILHAIEDTFEVDLEHRMNND